MKIIGKIIQILPLQSGESKSGNPWAIQPFIIETDEQYPKKICFEIFGEKRIKENPIAVDTTVQVSFDAESREYNGRWYTTLRAYMVGAPQTNIVEPDAQPVQTKYVATEPESNVNFI